MKDTHMTMVYETDEGPITLDRKSLIELDKSSIINILFEISKDFTDYRSNLRRQVETYREFSEVKNKEITDSMIRDLKIAKELLCNYFERL